MRFFYHLAVALLFGPPVCCCLNVKINNSKQTKRYYAQYHILLFMISDHKLNYKFHSTHKIIQAPIAFKRFTCILIFPYTNPICSAK